MQCGTPKIAVNELEAKQLQQVAIKLQRFGIEPSVETLQALIQTANVHYPHHPEGLLMVADSVLKFFSEHATRYNQQERSWYRLGRWFFRTW